MELYFCVLKIVFPYIQWKCLLYDDDDDVDDDDKQNDFAFPGRSSPWPWPSLTLWPWRQAGGLVCVFEFLCSNLKSDILYHIFLPSNWIEFPLLRLQQQPGTQQQEQQVSNTPLSPLFFVFHKNLFFFFFLFLLIPSFLLYFCSLFSLYKY